MKNSEFVFLTREIGIKFDPGFCAGKNWKSMSILDVVVVCAVV